MDDDVSRRSLLESDLATAVRSGCLEVYFQPQFHARGGHLVGFEALARWFDKRRGFVAPDEFIPIAEQSGLIEELGALVMSTACMQLRAWRDAGLVAEDCFMAINVSVMQLHSGKLITMVRDCIERQQLKPHNIEIELTESTVMDDAAAAIEQLAELSEFGVRIAIDDFGTGYSSLSYLQRLPIKTLKIDRSFTNALETHAGSQVIVQSIIALARSLGLAVVAEGVETRAEADYLRDQGCDLLQGYYLAKPETADAIEAYLRRDTSARDI
jgi:EAL domain-containing protein (putative c-di-GMP-specific phosphodiesterase class I)